MRVFPWVLLFLLAGWMLLVLYPQVLPFGLRQNLGLVHTPRQQVVQAFERAGLSETTSVKAWRAAGIEALVEPQQVALPFSRKLYFAQEPRSFGFRFTVDRGRVVTIALSEDLDGEEAFVELYQVEQGADGPTFSLLEARPLGRDSLRFFGDASLELILRVDVAPVVMGKVELRVHAEPYLSVFPVEGARMPDVGSVWGDPRDGGRRKHEGIDIFAARGTPLLAAADARVTDVRTGGLGGKQVWLTTAEGWRLYYAHLDEQLAYENSYVAAGDVVGTVGNTGNAERTPPHLHFGIYPAGGAVDPLPFVALPEYAPLQQGLNLPAFARLSGRSAVKLAPSPNGRSSSAAQVSPHHLMQVLEAEGDAVRVALADGTSGWLPRGRVEELAEPLYTVRSAAAQELYRRAEDRSVPIAAIAAGESIAVLAEAARGRWVRTAEGLAWMGE